MTTFPSRALSLLWVLALSAALSAAEPLDVPEAQKNHWAWKPPASRPLPAVRDAAWARNPVDLFIRAKQEEIGVRPAAPASREQLLRRVTFDLIGLPPTPAEIDAFVNDPSPDVWDRVVDRLLASPHYGERWGRHWLDLARYADSNGYEHDEIRPDAWRYRDYVIRSLNADTPYDRFVQEQLAGDELFPDDLAARAATGFNLLGPDMTDAADQAQRRLNTLNDMTDTAALAFLGLTVACARCHDHKFEPIPQTDYYRLQAFFTPAVFRRDLPVATPEQRAAHDRATRAYLDQTRAVRDAIVQLESPYRQKLFEVKLARLSDVAQAAHRTPEARRDGGQKEIVAETARLVAVSAQEVARALPAEAKSRLQQLQAELKRHDALKPPPLPAAMGLQDGPAPKTYLLERGELGNKTEEVFPGYPVILSSDGEPRPARVVPPRPGTTGRRAALAHWLTRPGHPLTARVLVNRVWQHHFGKGLVATPNDFGVRGQPPTHPELLDWLAVEFVTPSPQPSPPGGGEGAKKDQPSPPPGGEGAQTGQPSPPPGGEGRVRGWSIKRLHRLLLTSAAYQQSTRATPEALARDPENRWLTRMNRLRLEGEAVRDGLLEVSGRLNRTPFGPGVSPPIPADALQGFKGWVVSPDANDHARRSVYLFARRNLRFPFLEAFDLPDSNLSCPKRERSTTAPQALALLNAADVMESARHLATRLRRETRSDDEAVERAYRLTLGRRPTAPEAARARAFLQGSPLAELCRALFNVNEFVYLD